ncbi:MAG: hypothetical protein A2138_10230 [Deltaproteobacteria bacterium RBG_16_71_12]|nr:MAG: hypothetical protein A2138_10230 [Deltaproteobacteria bacterium RBG_16_71_12]
MPSTATWTWAPRAATEPTTPPRTESQRPRSVDGAGRVRAVTLPPQPAAEVTGKPPDEDASVVNARFSGDT